MTDKNINLDPLDSLIDSLLENTSQGIDNVEADLDPQTAQLFQTASQLILKNQQYPGTPEPPPQNRIELLTSFRSQTNNRSQTKQTRKSLFSQYPAIKWAVAVGAGLLVLVSTQLLADSPIPNLPASAGIQNSILPLIILTILAIIIIVLFLRRK